MKNKNIQNINTIGTIARIITIIIRIFVIIAIVCSLMVTVLAGIALANKDKEDITIKGAGKAEIVASSFGGHIETSDKPEKTSLMAGRLHLNITEEKDSDDNSYMTIDAKLDEIHIKDIALFALVISIAAVLFLTAVMIALHFGGKLAKSLEKCESPFEENVIRCMKNFGFSLIPMGVIRVLIFGITNIPTLLMICVVLLFVYIFNYGAQLQKESDETL